MNGRFSRLSVLVVACTAFLGPGSAFGEESGPRQASHPVPAEAVDRPGTIYSPLDAAEDSHRLSEARRRWAIDRQLEVLDAVRQSHAGTVPRYVDVTALPVSPGAARRALRRGYLPGYPYPYSLGLGVVVRPGAWPAVPLFGSVPYYPYAVQPVGHEKIWTGPNSYIYRPLYPEQFQPAPPEPSRQPTPARREPPRPDANVVPPRVEGQVPGQQAPPPPGRSGPQEM